jgi:hypothetical protein
MAFKDLFNNLSEKFYVSKAEQEALESKLAGKETSKKEENEKEKERRQN